MGNKRRGTAAKEAKKREKKALKRRREGIAAVIFCVILALAAVLIVVFSRPRYAEFDKGDGFYTNTLNKKKYIAADFDVYELSSEFTEDEYYGTMEDYKVYKIPGVSEDKWLVRMLDEELFEIFYEENETLPALSEFDADLMYLFVDANIIINYEEIADADTIAAAIDIIENGEEILRLDGITESYKIRFKSDKYRWFYMCCEYVVTESGSYFLDYSTYTYKDAKGLLDDYVEILRENEG